MTGTYQFDALVIGSGIAGLTAAIKLAEQNLSVGIVSREADPHVANTYYAQGGIIYPQEDDQLLASDIDKASHGTSNSKAASILAARGREIFAEILLKKAQVSFDINGQGGLNFTKEAAHSVARIAYRGDYTGKEIQTALLNYIKQFSNVSLLAGHTAIDLITPAHHGVKIQQRYEAERVLGAYLLNQKTCEVVKVIARATVLATGGLGSLYLHNSNSPSSRGDGHAMAKRAGAVLTNLEFIQFHPTTFYDRSSHRRFLISEAVRGEGGRLINSHGEPFMIKYHKDQELAPRDVVARAIVEEMIATKHECVYLDVTHRAPLQKRFPTIYQHCIESGIDIDKSPIPVVPAAHYSCGGIKTDLKGQTTLDGLYAVGEAACTGLHGANRLASTALLEGLTMGYIAAENIGESIVRKELYQSNLLRDWELGKEIATDSELIEQDWRILRQTMWNYVGLIRTNDRLMRAQAMFRELNAQVQQFYKHAELRDDLIGLRNAIEVAALIVNASVRNKKSCGCFYRKS